MWLPWFLSSIPSHSHAFPGVGTVLSYLAATREKGASGASRESHLLGVEARGDMFRLYREQLWEDQNTLFRDKQRRELEG